MTTETTTPEQQEQEAVQETQTPATQAVTSNRNQNMSGALFRNDKGDNPKRPDYRGRCIIDEKERTISGWIKTDRNNKNYLSLSFRDPQPQVEDGIL